MTNPTEAPSNSLREVDQILDFVQSAGPRSLIERLSQHTDRASVLYRALIDSSEGRSDDEIMAITGMDPRTHHKALSELKARLHAGLLDLDLRRAGVDPLGQKMYNVNLRRARATTLDWFRNGYAAAAEARRAFNEALEVELWDAALSVLPPLLHWASITADHDDLNNLFRQRDAIRECQLALDHCFEYWSRTQAILASSRRPYTPEVVALCDQAIQTLSPVVEKHSTFRLTEFLLRFRARRLEADMDYMQAYLHAVELSMLMDRYPLFSTRPRRGRNLHVMVRLLLRLGDYKAIDEKLQRGETFFVPGHREWFEFQDARLTYLMHVRSYQQAFKLVTRLRSRREFASLPTPSKEELQLALLYAEYFTKRPLSASFSVDRAKPGDLTRSLLAELPSFREDRTGNYVSVIILEVLICIESRRGRMYLIDRIESLVKFRNRHLKGQGTSQAAQFIEMLRLILKHDFNRQLFLREAESLRQKLDIFDPTDTTRNELVLPYGVLWDEIVERLPNEPWLTD